MANHTKRSPEFAEELRDLIEKLKTLSMTVDNTPDANICKEVIRILTVNTTDSPCVVKAREDEPIFVLRGQDRISSGLTLAWAQLYDDVKAEISGIHAYAYDGSPRSTDAMECSEQMARYHTRKFPD